MKKINPEIIKLNNTTDCQCIAERIWQGYSYMNKKITY